MLYHVSTRRMKPNMAIYNVPDYHQFPARVVWKWSRHGRRLCDQGSGRYLLQLSTPPEDEVFEFIGIADLTVEEIKALLGEPEPESVPGDEGEFSDRFPSLKVSHDKLNVEISSESMSTQVLNIDREANGDFEWNFMLAEQPERLSAHRPLDPEEGDIDSLGLTFDAIGLAVGDYMITLKVFGLTLVRDSPQEIPIMLTVRPPLTPQAVQPPGLVGRPIHRQIGHTHRRAFRWRF